MKIRNIDVSVVPIELVRPFKIQLAEVPAKDHVIVKIHTDEGHVGYGEISPLPQFAGETGSAMADIVRNIFAPAIVGRDPTNIVEVIAILDDAIEGNHLAKSTIDFALHDLVGKILGAPAYTLLGGKLKDRIPLCWVVGIADPKELMPAIEEKINEGYRCIKLKAGINPKEDIERLKLVRKEVGDDINIRVDANQGYSPEVAIKTIRKMEEFDPEYVEQPVSRYDKDALTKVTHAVGTPILADECIFSIYDVIELVRKRAASIINIKVGKLGGLYNSSIAAGIAWAAGIPCMVGSMLESGIGTLAGAHFAAATPAVSYACELIGPLMYKRDILESPLVYEDGELEVPDGNGLGIGLSEEL